MNAGPGVLRADARLMCAPDLRLQFEADGRVAIEIGEERVWHGDARIMEILGVFARPTQFADAMKVLGARAVSATDWVDRAESVRRLVASGVLLERRAQIEAGARTFSAAPVHIRM
jgi:hypothetical protein